MMAVRRWRFRDYEYRARGVIEHRPSDAADNGPKTAMAVRANDDEISIPVHGSLDKSMRGVTVLHHALGDEPGFLEGGSRTTSKRFLVLVQAGCFGGLRSSHLRAAQPRIPLWVHVRDAQNAYRRAVECRPSANGVGGGRGALRAVFSQQDAGDVISTGD
jgi:hypothetical protein